MTPKKPNPPQFKILVVDDHPAVREALAIRVAAQPDLTVCGEADSVGAALEVIERTQPDVAIIDIGLKGSDGLDLIKRVKARNEHIRMLIWSMYPESLYAERAMRAGAMGYIEKEQATDKIIDAIRQLLAGNVYLSPDMTQRLLHRAVGESSPTLASSPLDALSDRELEVFRMIGLGLKAQEIAAQLHLSVKTVETYRDRLRTKLNLADGAALARHAFQWQLEQGGNG